MTTATEQFSPTARSAQVRTFAQVVSQMQNDLATMSSAERVAQFGFTAIEDSAIPAFDSLGQARMLIGRQSDGTYGVVYMDGPPPPKPSQPIVSARQLGVFVAHDGTFTGGHTRPADVARFDVHMSAASGFTPDGSTIVGNIPEAGGILVNSDSVTKYVKVVAVSRAKDSQTGGWIASTPTDEIAVLPLPATQIAAGAIGTKELAADFIWSSRVVIGSTSGASVELDGRDPLMPGLHAYDQQRERTFRLDATTGAVFIKGQIRTADSGERLVWRETDDHDIRFYPATGNRWASLYARSFTVNGVDYGGLLFQGSQFSNGRRSYIWVLPDYISLYRGTNSGADAATVFNLTDTGLNFNARTATAGTSYAGLDVNPSDLLLRWGTYQLYFGGPNTQAYFARDSSRYISIQAGGLDLKHSNEIGFTVASRYWYMLDRIFACDWLKSGFYFATTGVDVYNPSSGAALAIAASGFVTKSARESKTDIEPLPFDCIDVIRGARASMWEYLADQRDDRGRYRHAEKRFGPMADDLPTALHRRTADGSLGLGLGDQIAVVWDATARHADTLDDQAESIAHLGRRIDDLSRRLADALEAS